MALSSRLLSQWLLQLQQKHQLQWLHLLLHLHLHLHLQRLLRQLQKLLQLQPQPQPLQPRSLTPLTRSLTLTKLCSKPKAKPSLTTWSPK